MHLHLADSNKAKPWKQPYLSLQTHTASGLDNVSHIIIDNDSH